MICGAQSEEEEIPDLDPERTIAYEVGIIRQFTDDLTIDITGFTKDIDKLVNSVHVDITNDYSYFLNGEFEGMLHGIYGRVQGFELTIRKWRTAGNRISGLLSYTYSVAKGKGSSRNLGYLTYYRQQPDVTESQSLGMGSTSYLVWSIGHPIALRCCCQSYRQIRERFALHTESESPRQTRYQLEAVPTDL